MKKFYYFWFFICAGWGLIFSQLNEEIDMSLMDGPRSFIGSAIMLFMILGIDLSISKGAMLHKPSLNFKPWQAYPVGLITFILMKIKGHPPFELSRSTSTVTKRLIIHGLQGETE